jgi:hypothetical protein
MSSEASSVGLMSNDEKLMRKAFIHAMEDRVLACHFVEDGMKD